MGLPSFWEENGKLLSQVEYQAQLVICRLDHGKFEDMHQSLSWKTIIEKLSVEFEIIDAFKLFVLSCQIFHTWTM